jgi:hypothetical protein
MLYDINRYFNVLKTGSIKNRISEASMERFVRMVLSSAPTLDKELHTGEIFRIGVLITTKNVSQAVVFLSFELEFIQLVDSPREIELGAGSYEIETEWLLKALQQTKGTTIRVECRADDIPQVIEFPLCILPSDEGAEDGETDEAIQQ